MQDAVYWIWLSLGLGIASPAARTVIEKELDAKTIYQTDMTALIQQEIFTAPLWNRIKSQPLQKAEKIVRHCQQKGYHIITIRDSCYPQQLLSLADPPLVLYAEGSWELLGKMHNLPVLAVVGTRNPSAYGARVSENMSYDLARAGFIIVSGLAQGIDAHAHYGALQAEKKTIAVLGCGLDVRYPVQNQQLRQRILQTGGTVLSELIPESSVNGRYFPTRNRLIAGLSQGVLVVEAAKRSGSLHTASHALEQGKDVFAVPSDIYDPKAAGTLGLIRDGAIPAISTLDIAYPYFAHFANSIEQEKLLPSQKRPVYYKEKQLRPQQWVQEGKDRQTNTIKKQQTMRSVQPHFDWTLLCNSTDDCSQKEKKQPPQNMDRMMQRQETIKQATQIENKNEEMTLQQYGNSFVQGLTNEQKKVYSILTDQPQGLDEIAKRCEMSIGEVTAVLFEIGVPNPVKSYPGRKFSL